MNVKKHTLPDESITQSEHHKHVTKDKSKMYYHHFEMFFFDHNGEREVVHLSYYTTLDGNIKRDLDMRAELSRLQDYNRDLNRYDTHLGTSNEYIEKAAEKKQTLELYRSLRETHLKPGNSGWYYKN